MKKFLVCSLLVGALALAPARKVSAGVLVAPLDLHITYYAFFYGGIFALIPATHVFGMGIILLDKKGLNKNQLADQIEEKHTVPYASAQKLADLIQFKAKLKMKTKSNSQEKYLTIGLSIEEVTQIMEETTDWAPADIESKVIELALPQALGL